MRSVQGTFLAALTLFPPWQWVWGAQHPPISMGKTSLLQGFLSSWTPKILYSFCRVSCGSGIEAGSGFSVLVPVWILGYLIGPRALGVSERIQVGQWSQPGACSLGKCHSQRSGLRAGGNPTSARLFSFIVSGSMSSCEAYLRGKGGGFLNS